MGCAGIKYSESTPRAMMYSSSLVWVYPCMEETFLPMLTQLPLRLAILGKGLKNRNLLNQLNQLRPRRLSTDATLGCPFLRS